MIDKYRYTVEWSEEDNCYIATCTELDYLLAFGDTQEEALAEIKSAVDGALQLLKKDRCEVPAPLSSRSFRGKILLRVSADLHKKLSYKSIEADQSLNNFIILLIEKALSISDLEQKIDKNSKEIIAFKTIFEKMIDNSTYFIYQAQKGQNSLNIDTTLISDKSQHSEYPCMEQSAFNIPFGICNEQGVNYERN